MQRTVFRSRWLPYVLVFPQMAVTVVFFFWPALKSLQLSLYRVSPFGDTTTFIGLDNFTKLLSEPDYYRSVVNSLVFAAGVTGLAVAGGPLLAPPPPPKNPGPGPHSPPLPWPPRTPPPGAGPIFLFLFP